MTRFTRAARPRLAEQVCLLTAALVLSVPALAENAFNSLDLLALAAWAGLILRSTR